MPNYHPETHSAFSKAAEATAKGSHLLVFREPEIFACVLTDIDFTDVGAAISEVPTFEQNSLHAAGCFEGSFCHQLCSSQ